MNMRHELLSEAAERRDVDGRGRPTRTHRRTCMAAVLLAASALALLAAIHAPALTLAQGSSCEATLTRTVSPETVTLGDLVTVTLRFDAKNCPELESKPNPLHIVYAIDVSGSMAGQPLTDTLEAVRQGLAGLDLIGHPSTEVGIVAFNDQVTTRCQLSNSEAALVSCLRTITAFGGSQIEVGILAGLDILAEGRQGLGQDVTPNEVMVLLSQGQNRLGCEPMKAAARKAKGQGVLMVTVCTSASCDSQCLRECASSARYFYFMDQVVGLNAVLGSLQRPETPIIGLKQLTVVDRLPPNMGLVEDAASLGNWDPVARTLTVPLAAGNSTSGLQVAYRIEPLDVGTHATSLGATANFTDLKGFGGSVTAAISSITVLPNGSPPRPAIRSSLVLERDSLALGQRSAVTATLDMTLPEPPGNTHLALVADRSGSMSGDPMVKLIQGARGMLDRLESVAVDDFAAAIVRFNSVPDLLCDLTGDFSLLRACVDGIDPAEGGTNIAFGLQEGHKALKPGTAWHGGKDLVVFTDGQNNTGCDPVRAAANAIKADGVVVHAVCLGSGCDAFCMQQAASSPRHFFDVPLSADLPQAFDGIAQDLLARRGVEGVNLLLKVPPHLRLVPDSFSVEPDLVDQAGVHFNLPRLPQGGLRLTFAVEAVAGGKGVLELESNLPMLRAATLSGQTQSKPLDVPVTPTLPAVTATLVEPTATATLAPSTTPTPKPDSGRAAIFLPLVLSEAHQAEPVDLVLVIDSSLSMGERLGAEGSKLEAAQAAVDALLSALDLKRHRVALVATDAAARRLQPLGHDGEAVRGALAQLQLGGGTALDQGLDLATEMLLGDERRGMTRGVILLLSDGRAHEAAPEDAVAAADRARRLKLEVYAVGLGREVDARTLSAIADSPERYQAAPDRAAALRAFGRAAAWMDCPAEAVWGGR